VAEESLFDFRHASTQTKRDPSLCPARANNAVENQERETPLGMTAAFGARSVANQRYLGKKSTHPPLSFRGPSVAEESLFVLASAEL
jgi:hypothetical protein